MCCDNIRTICIAVAAQAAVSVSAAQNILPQQTPKDLSRLKSATKVIFARSHKCTERFGALKTG